MVALGVVTGIGALALPLSAHASKITLGGMNNDPDANQYGYGELTVEVGGSISLYFTDYNGINLTDYSFELGKVMNNGMVRGMVVPVVTTNSGTGYTLSMYTGVPGASGDEECNNTLLTNNSMRRNLCYSDSARAIPAVGSDGKIQPGISAWGYKIFHDTITREDFDGGYMLSHKTDYDPCIDGSENDNQYTCWKAVPARSSGSVIIDSRDAGESRDYHTGIEFAVSTDGEQAQGKYSIGLIFTAIVKD